MLFKNHVSCIVTSIVMLVLGLCMAILGTVCTGAPLTFVGVFTVWGRAFTINYLAALVFPVDVWGAKLSAVLKLEPGKLGFALINNLVSTAVFVTVVSIGMTLLEVGFTPIFWKAWLSLYPILFGAGFVVAFIVSTFAMKFAIATVQKAEAAK